MIGEGQGQLAPTSRPSTRNERNRATSSVASTNGLRLVAIGFAMGMAFSAMISSLFQSSGHTGFTGLDLDLLATAPYHTELVEESCDCDKPSPVTAETELVDSKQSSLLNTTHPATNRSSSNGSTQHLQNPNITLTADANSDFPDFDPTAPAVIVTKIQGRNTVGALNQSLCLLSYAYNHRVNYDIIVFSATNISEKQFNLVKNTVAPAKFRLIVDNPGVQEMVDALPDDRKQHLLERCNVTNSSQLEWTTRCNEKSSSGTTYMPIQYNWQAEFRSLHLWKHPALAKYKYMLWMDTDGFCTRVWKYDPIAIMRRNDMVILFDNFPMGKARGTEWPKLSEQAFGQSVCAIKLKKGHLRAVRGKCSSAELNQIHGFFHVTDLDFYRSEPVMRWQRIMIGNNTFSRKYDDQIAVTMPAAALAGNRSWDMRSIGMNMSVAHDFILDGKGKERIGGYKGFWRDRAPTVFPEAYGKCNAVSPG